MGLYEQGVFDMKMAVDYLLTRGYGNDFRLEDFQEIRLEDFRSTFLGSESKRLIKVITKGHHREFFNAANRLGILQECLDTQVSFSSPEYKFTGTLSSYLQYRVDQNDDYSKKYTDILAEIQEMQNARPEVTTQQNQPLTYGSGTPFEEGDILKYDELSEDQKKLYDSLKDAIQNNGNVANVLGKYRNINIIRVLSAADPNGNILMIDAIEKNVEIAKTIFNHANQFATAPTDQTRISNVTDILAKKALGAIADKNENEIAKKIIDFSTQVDDRSIANKLEEEFKNAVKSGDFTKANKFYAFGERNQPNIFKDELLKSSWLSDTIAEIKHSKNTKFLENTLKFAKGNNMLDEVFKAKIGNKQKTLLEVAEEERVKEKVEGVIRDAGINISQYENAASSLDKNQKILNFLCENKEKIAFGGVGLLLAVGCIAAAYTLGQPLIGIGAVVGAAMMLMSVLAITTVRGYEMWGSAKNLLNDLFVSKPGPTNREI